jgi:hypothetical protein
MRFHHAVLAAAALLLGAPAAHALTIDDFSTVDTAFIAPGPFATTAQGGLPATAIGGFRETTLTRISGIGSLEFTDDGAVGSFGFAPNVNGTTSLTYDGAADNVLDTAGLGEDLTVDGLVLRIVLRSDIVGPLAITVYSGANASSISIPTPGLGLGAAFTTVDIPFASFGIVSGTGADFANVGAIVLTAASNNIGHDLQIDLIETVPEPTTALLLGLGLAATAGVVRRRAS